MRLSDFNYELPKELIAQYPSRKRGDDRLLVLNKSKASFEEKIFADIVDCFSAGDILVLNDTRVIPARLFGRRKTGGRVEVFILDKAKEPVEALVRPSGRLKDGEEILLDSGDSARVLGRADVGRLVEFTKPLEDIISECGHVPLPPYISRPDEPADKERYQTVYASSEGATASPTAGLHFTEDSIEKLKEKGVEIAFVTLHVSYGTFAPVKEETVENHKMHSEFYRVSKEDSRKVGKAAARKARIFACGTTTLRALETCADSLKGPETGSRAGFEGSTNLFIYPGFEFKIVDALITNFHLPKSTLLLLTSAFAGKELLFRAYDYAIREGFRFFSYGDAMVIV